MKRKLNKSSAKAEETYMQRVRREAGLREIKLSRQKVNTIFRTWLRQNAARFPFTITARRLTSKDAPNYGTCYGFKGVCNELYFSVDSRDLMVHFDLNGQYYDGMCDFEVHPAVTAKGEYTCSLCVENYRSQQGKKKSQRTFDAKRPRHFDRLEDLYADHCFEPLLAWAKKNIKPGRVLVYVGEPNDSRMAQIRPVRDVLTFSKPYRVIPVVLAKSTERKAVFAL